MSGQVTIEMRSKALAEGGIEAVVTLPTFRRPEHLVKTLRSLEDQRTRRPFAVVVMENDAEKREGLAAAAAFLAESPLPGLVLIAHERGNCSAYNAGWSTALSVFPRMRHLLVIDDDEIAAPDWLDRLTETTEQLGADIVGGPQIPVFEGGAAGGAARHPVFLPPYETTGLVPILYSSGNVLISRHVLERMEPPFLDTAFNFIGGGDSDFYSRCRAKGFRFGWCREAPIFETTPARRAEFSWLNARVMRNGAVAAIIERRRRVSLLRRIGKSAAMLAASPLRGALLACRSRSALIGLYPVQVAVGRFMAEFGVVNEQYRRPEQN